MITLQLQFDLITTVKRQLENYLLTGLECIISNVTLQE